MSCVILRRRLSMRPSMWRLRRMIVVITVDVDRWRTCTRKNKRVLHIDMISSTRSRRDSYVYGRESWGEVDRENGKDCSSKTTSREI
jgi:hypothetical protein